MTSKDITVERADLLSPEAEMLIRALNAELDALYPEEGANFFSLDPAEVAPGRGAFVIARYEGRAVACGAVRRLDGDETAGEVKRMYVAPEHRGRGLSRAVLQELEAEAKRLGLRRLVLETGERQPAAVALYESAGFARIPPFGEYVNSPLSVCMAKDLP